MTTSFDKAITAATAPNPHVEAVRQTFMPALAALRVLEREHPKKESAWLTRLAPIQAKVQAARAASVQDPEVERALEALVGGRGVNSGLLASSKSQITMSIDKIERFGAQELPHRNIWVAWPNTPRLILDMYGAIERLLTQLEIAVKDGGVLERRLTDKAAQRGVSTPVPESRPHAAEVTVESEFTL